ncbi:MAG: glycosyltransferase [Acidisphaera sp.]|nr:glycosyltransferase [Acidisphaera sp.]
MRNNRAVMLMRLQRFEEARDELTTLMTSHGEQPGLLCNLSNVLSSLGEQEEGVAAARRATELAPDLHLSWRSLLNALAYRPGAQASELLGVAQRASRCAARPSVPAWPGPPDPGRRLRVGLLSTTLKAHPVGWLTVAGFENLDPAAFEIVCFGQRDVSDPIARRFRAVAAEWHVVDGLDIAAVTTLVRGAAVDLLIDLSGYGDRGMMAACAARLAPVQIKWVGMQNGTSGLPEMDWFLTDRWETPEGAEAGYAERLLRMPDGYVCYSPPAYAPEVAPLPAEAAGHVTFGCFNNLAKITPEVIATWSELLGRVPDARLVLKTHQFGAAATRARVHRAFTSHGIDPSRVELRGTSPHRVLLEQYNGIDIVLDPFPYTGGLTTCEALWMGVPTVTLAGATFSARHAASHLSNVGLPDWVATDRDGYLRLAAERAADLPALAALRRSLRARVRRSPLCDAPRFGRHLGAALRRTWVDCCAGRQQVQLS